MSTLSAAINLLKDVIQRHGGGWRGLRSATMRSLRVLRSLGWRGLLRRIHAAYPASIQAVAPADTVEFPPPYPLSQVQQAVGVMAHVFYADLIDELASDLIHMPTPYVLMVSVVDEATYEAVLARFKALPGITALHIRIVPNRGRDLAPMLLTFRQEILALDLICHVHTKKSLYTGNEQGSWRRHLIDNLLGSRERIARILGTFQAMPELGMVYPESFRAVPWWGHTWLSNLRQARELGARLGIAIDARTYLDFPAGSMFWARVDALRPIYALHLSLNDFPEEHGQIDGTTQHAIERLLGLVVRKQGLILGIVPANDAHPWRSEGERNWMDYFREAMATRIDFAAIDAHLVSFDLFDTLVTRPFLTPDGARAYLAHRVEKTFGVTNFTALRERAEALARSQTGRDADNTAIYSAIRQLPEAHDLPVEAIHKLDVTLETQWLRPRNAVLEAACRQARAGKRVIALSDMYMDSDELGRVLPAPVRQALQSVYVSCETGWRKDDGDAWHYLPTLEKVKPAHWLHVGDNEHADVQLPPNMGFLPPVHVARPSALLDLIPALRPLRPTPAMSGRWQDQLWLGLIANRLADHADREPASCAPTFTIISPDTFGYVVFGPLLLDYSAWLARRARERGASKLLFLSREGYALKQAFERVQATATAPATISSDYLLVSRRGVNTPSLRQMDDLADIFAAPYTGSLHGLLEARLGTGIAAAAMDALGHAKLQSEIYLPEMRHQLIEWLQPASTALLAIARAERDAYLAYWSEQNTGNSPIVADIGYAGTIQTRLSTLTGQALGGTYFALSQAARQIDEHGGWAEARFHDDRDAATENKAPVMQYHLLLEAVLTSPNGQFSHFERDADGVTPIHRGQPANPKRWATIERIQAGALAFIDDVCAVTGPETLELSFNTSHIQQPLQCVATGRWQLTSWANLLNVEDHYTGHGNVAVIDH